MIHPGAMMMRPVNALLTLMVVSLLIGGIPLIIVPSQGSGSPQPFGHGDGIQMDGPCDGFFTENLGQWKNGASMIAETSFGHIGLFDSCIAIDLADQERSCGTIVRYDCVGGSKVSPIGTDPLPHPTSYFLGSDPKDWWIGARSFSSALYDDVWRGISMRYLFDEEHAKYEFIIDPYADPRDITVRVSGHRSLSVSGDNLMISLDDGRTLWDTGLKAYHLGDPGHTIPVAFHLIGDDTFKFRMGPYDRSRPVVIDPQLVYSTLIGGSGMENGGRSVLDRSGNIYSVTQTYSKDFPSTPGPYGTYSYADIAIFKFEPTLSTLAYAAFYGGTGVENSNAIVVNGKGEVYVSGNTQSTNLPITDGAYDTSLSKDFYYGLRWDIFVMGLNQTGKGLLFSTYVGDMGIDKAFDLAADSSGNVIVAGTAEKQNFTVTDDAYDETFNGGSSDMVIFKLNSNGSALLYSTFIGGIGWETPAEMVLENDDIIYLLGNTNSTDLPTTKGALDRVYDRDKDDCNPFIMRFNFSSNSIEMSTFLDPGTANGLAIDKEDDIYICGSTRNDTFTTTPGVLQSRRPGYMEGFLLKLDHNASKLKYSTFIAGSDVDCCKAVDVNSTGCAFVVGETSSLDFPVKEGAFDTNITNSRKVFLATVGPDASEYIYSTFVGGKINEMASSVNIASEDNAYISGYTGFGGFPTTQGAFSNTMKGILDVFISRFNCTRIFIPPSPPRNLNGRIEGASALLEWEGPLNDGGKPILGYLISRGSDKDKFSVVGTTANLTFVDPVPDLKLDYCYSVQAFNAIGNSTGSNFILLWEKDPPVFTEDRTPTNLSPGMRLKFEVVVTDNVPVDEVRVDFSLGNGLRNDSVIEMVEDGVYCLMIDLPDKELDVEYYFLAMDCKDNWASTQPRKIPVRGPFLPDIDTSSIPTTVEARSELEIRSRIKDNWGVEQVFIEYRIGDGQIRNSSMDHQYDDLYSYIMGAGGDPGDTITYKVSAKDVHGNWNDTTPSSILIVDSMPPMFVMDNTPIRCTTGDPLSFRLEIDEAISLEWARVHYHQGDGSTVTSEMSMVTQTIWVRTISIPDSIDALFYTFEASDTAGNINSTRERSIAVMDNDAPLLNNDTSDRKAYTGREFDFSCETTDNIDISSVQVRYWFDIDSVHTLDLKSENGQYGARISVPKDSIQPFTYILEITDTSGNSVRGGIRSVEVIDTIAPVIDPIPDLVSYVGRPIEVHAIVSDNIGIPSISWTGPIGPDSGDTWVGTFTVPGDRSITVLALDDAGNTASYMFTISVLPLDHDSDSDGLPDLVEIGLGLDPDDPSDSALDLDEDQLSNIDEFMRGTFLDREDSDSDLMPDGWEVAFGLDPLFASADQDTDRDGKSDLIEFLAGTDPTVSDDRGDGVDDGYGYDIIDIVLSIIVIIALAVLVSLLLRGRRAK